MTVKREKNRMNCSKVVVWFINICRQNDEKKKIVNSFQQTERLEVEEPFENIALIGDEFIKTIRKQEGGKKKII